MFAKTGDMDLPLGSAVSLPTLAAKAAARMGHPAALLIALDVTELDEHDSSLRTIHAHVAAGRS